MTTGKIPAVLDARTGPQDHPCTGMWQHRGANAGGHDVYACDSGGHSLIDRWHGPAGHECVSECGHAFTLEQARAAMAQVGRELPAVMEAAEAGGADLGDSELEPRELSVPEAIARAEDYPQYDAAGPGGRFDYWAHITGEPARYGRTEAGE